jgi:hypothetical protein
MSRMNCDCHATIAISQLTTDKKNHFAFNIRTPTSVGVKVLKMQMEISESKGTE